MIESPKKLPEQSQPLVVENRATRVWWEYLFHLDDRVRKLIRAFYAALGDGAVTVASLPATADVGAQRIVTDANSTTFNATVAGGGANVVPVFWNGTNWKIG